MKIIGKLIIVLIIIIGLYGIYNLFQNNTNKYQKYEYSIDSLTTQIKVLDSIHHKQDSAIIVYKDSIIYKDKIIIEEKIKYIKIKNKYNEIHNYVSNYTPTQLDSFFTKRYGY